ncbi:MAG: hypothetical protein WD059_08175 [Balneolaceae bacterium]
MDTTDIHILNWQDENFLLPKLEHEIKTIQSFDSRDEVEYQITDMGTVITLPEISQNSVDQILEVIIQK